MELRANLITSSSAAAAVSSPSHLSHSPSHKSPTPLPHDSPISQVAADFELLCGYLFCVSVEG